MKLVRSDFLRASIAVAGVGMAVILAACGGRESTASKSAAAYADAKSKGVEVGGGHGGHGGDATASGEMPGMDHSTMAPGSMAGMDHSTMAPGSMAGMDHSTMAPGSLAGMDHSTMQPGSMAGMDHSKMQPGSMAGMDHSKMQPGSMAGMDHSTMQSGSLAGMDRSQTQSGSMAGMDHSEMQSGNMAGMDHSKMQPGSMPGMDHSQMQGGMAGMQHGGGAIPPGGLWGPVEGSLAPPGVPAGSTGMAGMDHSNLPGMDPSQMQNPDSGARTPARARTSSGMAAIRPSETLTRDSRDLAAPSSLMEAGKATGTGHDKGNEP